MSGVAINEEKRGLVILDWSNGALQTFLMQFSHNSVLILPELVLA
jgi:hypothetical protein